MLDNNNEMFPMEFAMTPDERETIITYCLGVGRYISTWMINPIPEIEHLQKLDAMSDGALIEVRNYLDNWKMRLEMSEAPEFHNV